MYIKCFHIGYKLSFSATIHFVKGNRRRKIEYHNMQPHSQTFICCCFRVNEFGQYDCLLRFNFLLLRFGHRRLISLSILCYSVIISPIFISFSLSYYLFHAPFFFACRIQRMKWPRYACMWEHCAVWFTWSPSLMAPQYWIGEFWFRWP